MRVLALDLSTHAGYALFEGEMGAKPKLLSYGTVHLLDGKSKERVHNYGGQRYPYSYLCAARAQLNKIWNLKEAHLPDPDVLVVEETNGSRNRYTQKVLEFLHHTLIGDCMSRKIGMVYLDSDGTNGWRKKLGLWMSKEQKRANAKLSKAKSAAKAKGVKLDKKALGIRGKTTKKHLAIERANAEYGLNLIVKDNDAADAICLGLAYFNHAVPCTGE